METFFTVWLALGAGITGGLTFTFSSFGMKGLAEVPHPGGMLAMQAINRVIINPLFLFIFIGTGIPAAAVVAIGVLDEADPLAVVAGIVFLVGIIVITAARNVPMNNVLDAIPADEPGAEQKWMNYNRDWTRWNHVRTVASIASSLLAILALAG